MDYSPADILTAFRRPWGRGEVERERKKERVESVVFPDRPVPPIVSTRQQLVARVSLSFPGLGDAPYTFRLTERGFRTLSQVCVFRRRATTVANDYAEH